MKCLIAAILAVATPCFGETLSFDVRVMGVRAAQLDVTYQLGTGRYSATGKLATIGLAGAIRSVSFDATATGTASGTALRPSTYSETSRTPDRTSVTRMAFRDGVPMLQSSSEPVRRRDADPAAQAGALDPLTAILAVLRPGTADTVCRRTARIFDGKRATRIVLRPAGREGAATMCRGSYERLDGFSRDDMKRPAFGFTMMLVPTGGGLHRVERIETETTFGNATLTRR